MMTSVAHGSGKQAVVVRGRMHHRGWVGCGQDQRRTRDGGRGISIPIPGFSTEKWRLSGRIVLVRGLSVPCVSGGPIVVIKRDN